MRGEAISWVDLDGWPPTIRVRLVDADAREWFFVDKVLIFDQDFDLTTPFPAPVGILCEILSATTDRVFVMTKDGRPDADDGTTRFVVRRDQIADEPLHDGVPLP